jgi:BioD-like phosphotransacetylase family protein
MNLLYITSNRPAVGKTVLALALMSRLRAQGRRVGYFKPFSGDPATDQDAAFAQELAIQGDVQATRATVSLAQAVLATANVAEVLEQIRAAIELLEASYEVLLVEGPSLQTSEGDLSGFSVDLARELAASVLAVVGYSPGFGPEDVSRLSDLFGAGLLGVLVNSVTRYRQTEVQHILAELPEDLGAKLLGAIPEDREMLAVTLGQVASHLKGEWVAGEEKAQDLVESFLIGGNIMDPGNTYFGRSEAQAVIVRGDRPDIQMAALSASVLGLVLTGGHRPLEYVYHEMEQLDVPLMVVPGDTEDTADALGSLIQEANPYHPRKLARFLELLEAHCRLEAVDGALD